MRRKHPQYGIGKSAQTCTPLFVASIDWMESTVLAASIAFANFGLTL
jgi:hypothetical protein